MQYIEENQMYPVALTIAGSDSGGGAGIQADLRTFNAFGVFGCSAVSAVTAQNPKRVTEILPVPAKVLTAQLDAVLSELAVAGVKTGMLFNSEIIECVADAVRKYHLSPVVDPVMVATSGAHLLCDDAVETLRKTLLPLAAWITPNIPEAELLLGKKLRTAADFADAAKACHEKWGVNTLLKTGHAPASQGMACDFVCAEGKCYTLSSPYVDGVAAAAHGTGCTLSSAMAAGFALKEPWKQVISQAKEFVLGSLAENVRIGKDIRAMYPPVENREEFIQLKPFRK